MKNLILIMVALIVWIMSPASVFAGYDFPKAISDYLKEKSLNYSPPIGSFDKYMIDFYKHNGLIQKPWSIVADFNGDGMDDFSGLMRSSSGKLDLVVVYSSKGERNHKVLFKEATRDGKSINIAVVLEPPGKIHGIPLENLEPKDLVADLKHPGIHLIFFEKAGVLFYWEDDAFKEIWTGD